MSGVTLDQLCFDPANPDDSANVGSHTLAGDGTQIDSQNINSEDWLNVASALHDGSGNALTSTGGALDVNIENMDFDIRDLSHTQDSVRIGNGTNLVEVNAAGEMCVKGNFTGSMSSIKNTNETVGLTAAEVLSTPLAGRTEVTIQNNGPKAIYIGSSASVTAANGLCIAKGASATFAWNDSVDIFAIGGVAGTDVRFMEAAA